MTTPVGTISLSDVNAELNLSPTALITMNDAAVRTLAGVGGSGTVISMNDLRGKSNRVAISLTISASTTNYDVYASRGPTYIAGISDLTVTINPGVTVYSSSTGSSAFVVPSAFNPGDTVTVINNGVIVGRGGAGGVGGMGPNSGNGTAGSNGGPGLNVQRPTTIQNLNRVAGGGGGGSGGAWQVTQVGDSPSVAYGGGGGGGGVANGPGGSGGSGNFNGSPGATAPLTAGGSGGAIGSGGTGGTGGAGGGYGSSGSRGGATPTVGAPSIRPGGASGAAVTGNPFITWNPTGTRSGPIS